MDTLFSLVYDAAMAPFEARVLGPRRRGLLADLRGDVLELGAGTGANLPHYVGPLERLVVEEPSPGMRARLRPRLASPRWPVDLVGAPAESLPFPDETFDGVVATLVLCSVRDLEAVAAEMWRVLKPGGTVRFIEHVRAEGAVEGLVQDLLTPAWRRVAANCHLNRRTIEVLRRARFSVSLQARDRWFLTGIAAKPETRGGSNP